LNKFFFLMMVLIYNPVYRQTPNSNDYPANDKDRGLILSQGKLEFDIGPAFMTKRKNKVQGYFNIRYALSKNLEIERLGLKYRFFKSENVQAALSLENYGLGKNLTGNWFHHSKFELTGKYNSKSYYAFLLQAGYYFANAHESESRNDGKSDELRLKFSLPLRLYYANSIIITSGLRYFYYESYGKNTAYFLKITMSQNIFYNMDIVLGVARSSYFKPTDSVLFNESYGNQLNIRIRYRFF